MARTCQTCGASLEGKRGDARYCSSICRTRAARLRPVRPATAIAPDQAPGRPAAATGAEAQSLGVTGSLADAALLLAEQIDAADQRTMPALMREWRAAMAELRAASKASASANPLDELRRRRERAG